MPEACLSLWPSDQCEWSIVDILRWSDLIQLSIYVGLALMLGHTFFIVIRFFGRYASTRRELRDCESDFGPDFHRKSRRLIADLSRGLRTLRGIAYAAPILALAGTSYGILAAPSWFHYSGVNGLFRDLAATVINTAVGILIAASATLSHNLLRTRAEALSEKLLPRRHSHEYNFRIVPVRPDPSFEKTAVGPTALCSDCRTCTGSSCHGVFGV